MKIRIRFAKRGTMRFIGHLDIMRYFQKSMRRHMWISATARASARIRLCRLRLLSVSA